MAANVHLCDDLYSRDVEDKGQYAIGWGPVGQNGSMPDPLFSYRRDIGEVPLQYSLAVYSAGGFVADLSPRLNLSLSRSRIAQLHANNWLDQRSRLLAFELLAYNPESGLHSFVTIAFELFAGATGMNAKLITGQTEAIRINLYSGPSGLALFVLQSLILIFFVVFCCKQLYQLYSSGIRKHFSVHNYYTSIT